MADLIHSFPPVAAKDARILILGSMPGVASLQANQYYAHPRNLFWPIIGKITGAGMDKPYGERLDILKSKQIALWDVLQSCVRPGSLDSAITAEIPQDFKSFFDKHAQITHIFFNGQKAAQSFARHVAKSLPGITMTALPSTSPAHAALSLDRKVQEWSRILMV